LFSGKNKKVSILEVRAFLSAVEKVYDYIIIAAPTVNTTADTAILAQCVDGVFIGGETKWRGFRRSAVGSTGIEIGRRQYYWNHLFRIVIL
jgi:hypothetical protein